MTKNEPTTVSLSDISGEIKITELFDEFEYVTLETSDESIFGNIDKLTIYDNKFFILDNAKTKKVFVFHNDGTFSHTIGTIGQAPGEYTNIEDFTIDEEQQRVIILSYPSAAYIYDMNGNFIQKKSLSSSLFWNICSYGDGFVCSTNHQTFTTGENAYLLFIFDRNFNLKRKLIPVLPIQVAFPPFIGTPLNCNEKEIVYFDNFTSTVHFINRDNIEVSKSIKLALDGEMPPEIYADVQSFMKETMNYSFFLNAFFADGKLWSSFKIKGSGRIAVFVMDFSENKKILSWSAEGFIRIFLRRNGYFYSAMEPTDILNGNKLFPIKAKTTKYPLENDSNPVILIFKEKKR
ncbi:MAG: 6-bladed beta-propeller [Prevotellaceae bacterium]|nr:6-bladed beta-propeller [Prevotellaceae bacterium]